VRPGKRVELPPPILWTRIACEPQDCGKAGDAFPKFGIQGIDAKNHGWIALLEGQKGARTEKAASQASSRCLALSLSHEDGDAQFSHGTRKFWKAYVARRILRDVPFFFPP